MQRAPSWPASRRRRPTSADPTTAGPDRITLEIGTRLPADYKEYVYWFGPVGFDEYLVVCVPGVENSNTELAA
ncbi:hypothetical protein, partial [Streptomyces arboris]